MDASESASPNAAAATIERDNVASEDDAAAAVVVNDTGTDTGKSTTHDDDDSDRILQTIYEKSTPSKIDEEKIKKAISFLRNKEIRDVSPTDKRKYLAKVGMCQNEIDTALDRLAAATTTAADSKEMTQGGNNRDEGQPHHHRRLQHHQNQNHYGGPPHSPGPLPPQNYMQSRHDSIRHEEGESSFFSFSSLAGGFCMSTFSLAALRWLNGGDFVLFPPPMAASTSMGSVGRIKQNNESQNEDDDGDGETDNLDEASFNSHGSEDPDISMILNGTTNHESDVHGNNQEQSSFEDLVMEVKELSTAINSLREEQDRTNRATAAQLGKGVTDDAMDFLRQQKPLVLQKKGDMAAIDKKDISRIMSLITDMVHELSQVQDSLGDVTVEDGNVASTESENDKKTDQTELSSKIDIAIGKGKEILALVHISSPDESSDDEIEAPPADHGNIEEDIVQDPNDTKDEEIEYVDDNDKSEEPDPTSATHETSGEISDINQSSKELEEALRSLSQNNETEELKIGAQMLYLYCKNLSKNPTVPRYRKIYTNNNSFKSKVGNLVGATDFLFALGFVERTNFFEWLPSNNIETSSDTKSQLDFALVALEILQKGSQSGDNGDTGSDSSKEKSEESSK